MSSFELRLNVGCGPDVRDGWVNIDSSYDHPEVLPGDARALTRWKRQADLVFLNHVLHLFDPEEARDVLDQCLIALKPGGQLVVVEPDVLHVIDCWVTSGEIDFIYDLVTSDVEPTTEGRLLRWVTWHGTRRSLWSPVSLGVACERMGFSSWEQPDASEGWAGERALESFVIRAVK